jgi:hypothetical protein
MGGRNESDLHNDTIWPEKVMYMRQEYGGMKLREKETKPMTSGIMGLPIVILRA